MDRQTRFFHRRESRGHRRCFRPRSRSALSRTLTEPPGSTSLRDKDDAMGVPYQTSPLRLYEASREYEDRVKAQVSWIPSSHVCLVDAGTCVHIVLGDAGHKERIPEMHRTWRKANWSIWCVSHYPLSTRARLPACRKGESQSDCFEYDHTDPASKTGVVRVNICALETSLIADYSRRRFINSGS